MGSGPHQEEIPVEVQVRQQKELQRAMLRQRRRGPKHTKRYRLKAVN
jgi:hypothetical protein